jgi:large subunit ribosomal protein L23
MQKHTGQILISPRITEKGAYLSEKGCYVFNVGAKANKGEIAAAIKTIYKVSPRKVTIAMVPRKQSVVRGTNRTGMTTGGKKAYVFLKSGDTIDLA